MRARTGCRLEPRSWTRRRLLRTAGTIGTPVLAGCLNRDNGDDDRSTGGDEPADESGEIAVEEVATGLVHPWGLEFVPDDHRMLITERPGRLRTLDPTTGTLAEVTGLPEVFATGQGGLLDVALHPEFPGDPWVYLTYAAANDAGDSATHLGRGRYDPDAGQVTDFETIHIARPFVDSDVHYGSRIVFGPDGLLYFTVGDRGFKNFGADHVSQETTNELGSTLRLTPDGSIPDDNPFVDDSGAEDAVFTYGHRNPQGMTIRPGTGEIWVSEHGEQDGDELNVLEPGGNYGWPIADSGCTYGTGEPVGGDESDRDDVIAPVHHWPCDTGGFPPGGTTFYDGDAFSDWRGNLFVGNLAGAYLGRFDVEGSTVEETEALLEHRQWRIRDVKVAPTTGVLYLAVDAESAPIVRISPTE